MDITETNVEIKCDYMKLFGLFFRIKGPELPLAIGRASGPGATKTPEIQFFVNTVSKVFQSSMLRSDCGRDCFLFRFSSLL